MKDSWANENQFVVEDLINVTTDKVIPWEKLNNKSKNGKIQIKYYNAMTIDFYWRVDDCIYIGPYWYGVDSQQTITYKFTVGGRGFNLYSDYFEDLWNNNDLTNRIL